VLESGDLRESSVFNAVDSTLLTKEPQDIANFFGFPVAVLDGTTRFTSGDIVDMVMNCRYFDIRRFDRLASRTDLIEKPIFHTLLERINSLDDDAGYQSYCRDVSGKNKAGRLAALAFGVDFDAVKARLRNQESAAMVRKKLHNGVLYQLVPDLGKHHDVLNRVLDYLVQLPEVVGPSGGWEELLQWCDKSSETEIKRVISKLAKQKIADKIANGI